MKKKFITKKQVVDALTDFILGEDKSPKLLTKVDGVGHNDHMLLITFYEGDNFYTDVRITMGDPVSYEVKEEDNESC